MRGWLTAAVLAAATAGLGAMAVETSPALAGGADAAAKASVDGPLLSARRVPAVLHRVIADSRLADRLDGLLADAAVGGARSSSCLVVRHGRRTLYERNPSEPLIPASTQKVLTAVAAVRGLGADERFETAVRSEAKPSGGVVDGPLWLVGGGDPLLATADYAASFENQPQVFTDFAGLADAIVAAGVRHIRGGIVGDETRYDNQRYVPTWRSGYIADSDVGPASALVVNDGFTQFTGRKTAAGSPPQHAASLLTTLLHARGVTVTGPPTTGSVPDNTAEVASISSPPVADIVAEMLAESDNLTAEMLTKEMGRRFAGAGSTTAGVRALREKLDDEGLPVERLTLVDGSGLDRGNRATCTVLMAAVSDAAPDSSIAAGFAIANRTGTLARRFVNHPAAGRLRAKTGSLEGVTGLTGFVDGPSGGPLAFALIANGIPSEAGGRALQERVGAALAAYPDAPPADELSL